MKIQEAKQGREPLTRNERLTMVIALWGAMLGTAAFVLQIWASLHEYPSLKLYGLQDQISIATSKDTRPTYRMTVVNEGFRPISILHVNAVLTTINPSMMVLDRSADTAGPNLRSWPPPEAITHEAAYDTLVRIDAQEAKTFDITFADLSVVQPQRFKVKFRDWDTNADREVGVLVYEYAATLDVSVKATYGSDLRYVRPVVIKTSPPENLR